MRKHRPLIGAPLFALTGLALLGQAAYAQQPGRAAPADQQRPMPSAEAGTSRPGASTAGGIQLKLMDVLVTAKPSVKAEVQHNDNLYSAPTNRAEDQILVLTPALLLEAKQGANVYKLRLSSTIGEYQSHKSDNYSNTNLNGQAELNLGTHLRARAEADHLDGVDPRGSTNSPLSPTPDHYRQTRAQGTLSFGAASARGRVDLELGRLQRHYVNNRAATAGSDRVTDDLGATFYWRVGPKTKLLFQGKHSTIDYALPTSTLGSVENTFQAGAEWEASAKTSGTFKFGMTKKNFDDPARSNATQITWTGAARWNPRTYSHVDLSLTRAPAETTGGVGNFIDHSSTAARWSHAWSTRFTTEATAAYVTDAYQGADRTDNTQNYGVKANFHARRWLNFGGEYTRSVRNSSNDDFDYRRNVFMLFVTAEL